MDTNPPTDTSTIITSPSTSPKHFGKGKKIVLIALMVLFLAGLSFGGWYVYNNFQDNKKVQPKSVKETNIAEVAKSTHPQLYFAYLDYDPQTQQVIQLSTGKTNGDIPSLSPEEPEADSNSFIYRVEQTSPENNLILTGWKIISKETIKSNDNKYVLRVDALYQRGSIIRVYLPNQTIIWTGKIK